MNSATNTTPSIETAPLCDLIAKAESIAAKIQTSTNDEEIAGLSSDFLELNDRIIQTPVSSLDDVRRKAAYLLASDDPLDAGVIKPLLRSLIAAVPA